MEVILVKTVVTCVLVIVFLLTIYLTPWFFGVSGRPRRSPMEPARGTPPAGRDTRRRRAGNA